MLRSETAIQASIAIAPFAPLREILSSHEDLAEMSDNVRIPSVQFSWCMHQEQLPKWLTTTSPAFSARLDDVRIAIAK